jgi:hypothetical protein
MSPDPKDRKIDPKIAWKDLLVASAPEQKARLEEILAKYPLDVTVVADVSKSGMSADDELIKFDSRTMRVYWLLGFAAWDVIECYSPVIIGSLEMGGPLNKWLEDDAKLGALEYKIRSRLIDARTLLNAPFPDRCQWPDDLPLPGTDRNDLKTLEVAAYDLTLISTAFAFLHELRHVMYFRDGAPSSRAEEELSCDVWAREFLTSAAGEYARVNDVPYAEVLRKRSMASAVGVFTLYETSEREGDAGTAKYPPIADRMEAALHATPLPPNDKFWIHYASVLLAILRSRKCEFSVTGANAKDYCHAMVEEIRRTS